MRLVTALLLLLAVACAQTPEENHTDYDHDHDHDHDHDDDDDAGSNSPASSVLKGVAIAASLAIGAASVWVPLRSQWYRNMNGIVGIAGAFSAGIFFALALLHILPESHEDMNHEWPDLVHDWHLPYTCMAGGYVLVLFIEVASGSHSHLHSPAAAEDRELALPKSEALPLATASASEMSQKGENQPPGNRSSRRVSMVVAAAQHSGNGAALVFALHAHSLIEGMVIGLRRDAGDVALVMGAVLAHKAFEGIALGSSLASEGLSEGLQATLHMAVFALATPIGVAAGWIAEEEMPKAAASVINAVSAGTLLYIAATELMPEHFASDRSQVRRKIFVFIIALVGMYLLSTLLHPEHDHDHDHDHGHAPH